MILTPSKALWQQIENLKSQDIPDKFSIDTITKFLRQSQVTINGEKVDIRKLLANNRGRTSIAKVQSRYDLAASLTFCTFN